MSALFENFAFDREPRWPLVLRLLGGSVVLHLAVIACIVYIPPLRDAFNIAALVAGSGYVDKAYKRTAFGEDIQIVETAPKFRYPPGYFAVGSPEAAAVATPDPNAPKIISEAKLQKPESTPSPSPSPLVSPSPPEVQAQASPTPGQQSNPGTSGDQKTGDKEAKSSDDAKQKEAQKQLDEIAAANHVELPADNEINRQPLKDLVAQANDLKNEGKLDLNQSFDIRIEADLDASGRLNKPTVTRKSGDPTLIDLSTRAIGVLNESGLLVFLKLLSDGQPLKVAFAIKQDQDQLNATFESELNNEDTARKKASTVNAALVLGQATRKGKDEEILMRSTSALAEGKKVILKFKMSRQAAGDLLKKQLASNSVPKQGNE